MTTCKDCYYYEACKFWDGYDDYYDELNVADCDHFKDKNKIIELPCNVGDVIYVVRSNSERDWIETHTVTDFVICKTDTENNGLLIRTTSTLFNSYNFNLYIFSNKSDAENKLKKIKR